MDTYEKKYKELVGKIEKAYLYAQTDSTKAVLEEIRPELIESEDERIRKEIINYFQCQSRDEPTRKDIHNKWIAWLEKQGEQKSIWHNEDEEPQRGSLILLIMQSGTPIVAKIIEPNHTFNHGERWAYIDDLLEKQGEKPAEEYNITGIGSKHAEGKLGKMIKNLKHDNEVLEQKPADEEMKEALRTEYEKGRADVIAEIQKPAWSEEDEAHINGIIDYLLDYKLLVYEEDMNVANGVQKELDWLKSLKQRIGE